MADKCQHHDEFEKLVERVNVVCGAWQLLDSTTGLSVSYDELASSMDGVPSNFDIDCNNRSTQKYEFDATFNVDGTVTIILRNELVLTRYYVAAIYGEITVYAQ